MFLDKNPLPLSTHKYRAPQVHVLFHDKFSDFNLNPEYTVKKKKNLFTNQTGIYNSNVSLPKITLALSKAVSVSGFEIWVRTLTLLFLCFVISVSVLNHIYVDLPRCKGDFFTLKVLLKEILVTGIIVTDEPDSFILYN